MFKIVQNIKLSNKLCRLEILICIFLLDSCIRVQYPGQVCHVEVSLYNKSNQLPLTHEFVVSCIQGDFNVEYLVLRGD